MNVPVTFCDCVPGVPVLHRTDGSQCPDSPETTDWPACATYPRLECVRRGALGQNKSTCTRKRTGDLTPVRISSPKPRGE